jgi:cell division protein FtsW (lipid II flippase)
VNLLFPASFSPNDRQQSRLLYLSALFLLLYAAILTLSPAVRQRQWPATLRWEHWAGYGTWLIGFAILHRQLCRHLPDRDPYLLPLVAALSGWGLMSIYRLLPTFGYRQTIWLAISLLSISFALRIPNLLEFLRRYKYIWLVSGLLLTAVTIFIGTYPSGNGPSLWFDLKVFFIQPSEPLKLLLIVYLAAYLADNLPVSFSLARLLAPTGLLVGAALAIFAVQRDLGTASLFILIYFGVIYLASSRRRILLVGALILLAAALTGYYLFDVIQLRIDAWLNPWVDPAGRSYQVVQSILGIAAGGILGRGPGLGSPAVIPVAVSDFIFAAIAEETGLLGVIVLLSLIGLMISRGLRVALRARSLWLRYLAAGLIIELALQSILIIGGNTRLLPLTGVTLPFVSYGGSSLLTSFAAIFFLLLISNEDEDLDPAPIQDALAYKFIFGGLGIALVAIALISGWWAIIRRDDLLTRADNPRPAIDDYYVRRGSLLDRDNNPIVTTQGSPGNYFRLVSIPSTGPLVGYSDPMVGQAGLESSLDSYLRGLQGNPTSTILVDDLLYGQHPTGLDVRLTLDRSIQALSDQLLEGHIGSLVLVNARSGEILAMSSYPNFDPNLIDEELDDWITDPNAPLLNRAVQGQYPPGTALAPFLYSLSIQRNILPSLPLSQAVAFNNRSWLCALPVTPPLTWPKAVAAGCPAFIQAIGQTLSPSDWLELYQTAGFAETPSLRMPVAPAQYLSIANFDGADPNLLALGQSGINVSPLQLALAAAALSTDSPRPVPVIASAVNTPTQGWVVLSTTPSSITLPVSSRAAINDLKVANKPYWQVNASAHAADRQLTWYLAGTTPDWPNTPLALVILLEENNPRLAQEIGTQVIEKTLNLSQQ